MSPRKRQRQQIEVQLDVLVERLRHADRNVGIGRRVRRGLRRDLQAALDLPHVLRVLVEPRAIRRRSTLDLEAATGLPSASRGCCGRRCRRAARSSAVLPSPNIRSNTTCGLSSIGSGFVGVDHEMQFV